MCCISVATSKDRLDNREPSSLKDGSILMHSPSSMVVRAAPGGSGWNVRWSSWGNYLFPRLDLLFPGPASGMQARSAPAFSSPPRARSRVTCGHFPCSLPRGTVLLFRQQPRSRLALVPRNLVLASRCGRCRIVVIYPLVEDGHKTHA